MATKTEKLVVNNLVYTLPSAETVVNDRNDMRNYFDQRDYKAGQTIRAVFQTGSKYVDVLNSQLVFTLNTTNVEGANVTWGKGSAINLIKNVRVYHKNGTELVNIQNHNLNQLIEDKASKSKRWFDTVGYLAGYDASNTLGSGLGTLAPPVYGGTVQQQPVVGGSQQFIIPLSCVAPIFNPMDKQLLPSVLAMGLILEIDLATNAEAVVRVGGAGSVELELKNIYLNLSCSTLADMTVATMNDFASKKLIEYVYIDTYTSRINNPQQNGTISTSINKAVSFADHIVAGEVISANRGTQIADEFALATTTGTTYQYQLGSIQLPSQVFTDTIHTSYLQALKTYNKFRDDADNPSMNWPLYNSNLYIKTCSFSKDQLLQLSQLPINSSRSLRYEQNYTPAPAEARTVFIFLHYIKSLRCSLSDCTVNQ
jgi:hypothetical protein